jgi:hypothetical protein
MIKCTLTDVPALAEKGQRMITVEAMAARIERLGRLTQGLACEVRLWKQADDPLLYAERRAYLGAIQDALAGLDSARAVLAQARQRLGDGVKAEG